jgi:ribosomal protein L4
MFFNQFKSLSFSVPNLHLTHKLNQKILLVVSKKTASLKLSTQNLKSVELISASHLNSLSLLKAKQVLLTPLAVNNIKEIYCD